MTSPSARHTRQRAPPQGNIPQPDFLQGSSVHAAPPQQGFPPPVHPALFYPPYPPPPLLWPPPLPLPPLLPNYHPGQYVNGLQYYHHPQYPYGYQPAAPVPMPMQVPAHHPRHAPVPVQGYPGLPRHAIAHHDRQLYRHQQHTNWNEELNSGFQQHHNTRVQLRSTHCAGGQQHQDGIRVPRENAPPPPPEPQPEQQNVQVSHAE